MDSHWKPDPLMDDGSIYFLQDMKQADKISQKRAFFRKLSVS